MVCVEALLHLSDTPEAAQRCVLPSLRVSPARQALLCVPHCDLTAPEGHLGCPCGGSGCWRGAGLAGALHRPVCDADGQGQTLQALDGLGKV